MNTHLVAVLEDSEYRLEWFNKNTPNYHLFTEVDDLINAVKQFNYDVIYLDHDLDGMAYVDPTNTYNCGTTAAVKLIELDLPRTKFIVHSLNYDESPNMVKILKTKFDNVVWIPFGWLDNPQGFLG